MSDQTIQPPPSERRSGGAAAAYVMLAFVMAFWAGNSIIGRAVRDDIPPLALALLRWSGALLVLAPFAVGRIVAERRLILEAWRSILLLGFLGVACFNALLYSGLRHTTAANALLLQAVIPAVVLGLELVLFFIRPRLLAVAGVLISIAGVAVIVFRGDPAALLRTGFNHGDLIVLVAAVCWALYTALLRTRPKLHPVSFLFSTFAVGVVFTMPLAAMEWAGGARIHWSAQTALAVAYVAVLPSLVAYALFNAAVARLGAGPAGQAITLMPLFGALLAALLLGEALHGYHLVGMVLVLFGIAVPAVERAWRARANIAAP